MNEHPLANNPSDLSNDELEKRLQELTKRWYTARRMNMDPSIMHQLDLMMQVYEQEKQRRIMNPENTGTVIDTDGPIAQADKA